MHNPSTNTATPAGSAASSQDLPQQQQQHKHVAFEALPVFSPISPADVDLTCCDALP
jgi:hypothetical protein